MCCLKPLSRWQFVIAVKEKLLYQSLKVMNLSLCQVLFRPVMSNLFGSRDQVLNKGGVGWGGGHLGIMKVHYIYYSFYHYIMHFVIIITLDLDSHKENAI